MAASFGEKLLLEVHEESLDEFLHDLRVLYGKSAENTRAHLGVAPIDQLLELFGPPPQPQPSLQVVESEVANDQIDPVTEEPEQTHHEAPVHPGSHRRPHPVLELSSISSAAGKSQVLYYLCALAVLPSVFNGTALGFNSGIVLIDTDSRFDPERLRTIARGIVHSKLQAADESEAVEAMILASLQHAHVFKPQSSSALLTTLQSLDTYLFDTSQHASSNRPVKAIFIDSATAFLWQDKLAEEIARTEEIGRSAAEIERERFERGTFHIGDLYADIVTALKRLQHIFDCAVIYTTIFFSGRQAANTNSSVPYGSYNPLDSALTGPAFRTPLHPPWGLFPTLRLVLQRDTVRPFPPGVTASEAKNDAPMRQEVVMRGEFSGSVNGWGREDWPMRILEELKRRGGGTFGFRVGKEGVAFE
ncbi:putative Rad51 family DNA repair protein [Aspergillus stella-maris]|uniref:putative Rad51 family DNA repair protein n=1 Tax=Aspergillus stella-maris TaxID=1810926 RepID=UPI003CCD0A75